MDAQTPGEPIQTATIPARLPFPIVGIGASAGGFAALAALLQQLPASPGMALVVILHLPADQQSNADRVLQRSTRLPVVQVNHVTLILPDQVYVIPPSSCLTMENGYLVLHEWERAPGDPTTIDVFFRALAMAHREKAIGIILSGMGSDGTTGLACIKEQGGVTLVQSPSDAGQPGMPQSAIDAGMADFVLDAAAMPAKLMALRGITQVIREHALHDNPPAEAGFDMGADPEQTLEDVLALLQQRTGHDFRDYKRSTLLRRLERRLQVCGQPDLPSYNALQRQDPAESHALLKDLLIGVTQFFRDREAFTVLENTVLPHIFKDKGPDDTVRVWVAACSTGEEAYSIAMLLAEQAAAMTDPPAIQVFASDIDAQAIRTARAGLYPASIAEDVSQERLLRYFTIENGAYKVRKTLRRQILFAEHNLLRDPAFSSLDLISCRNFLIYLKQDMHRQVLDTFRFALRPDWALMLGSSETVDPAPDLFAPINAGARLYRAKPGARPAHLRPVAPVHKVLHPRKIEPDPAPPAGVRQRSRLFSFAEIHLNKIAEQAPPSILVDGNAEIVHIAAEASHLLRHPGGEPTRDLVALVPPAWRLPLRTALFQAQKGGHAAGTGPVRYEEDGEQRAVDMTVQPFHDEHAEGLLMLVSFRHVLDLAPVVAPVDARDQPLLEQLDEELRRTRHQLLETMDQAEQSSAVLRTMVEELRTTVEELRAANRQLDATLEKANVANEELATANADLAQRLESLAKSHDDLNNLIASSDVATLFLDRAMRIQRYTPRIADLFNVIPADIGRPLLHITNRLENARLAEDAARVFETLQPLEQEVRSKDDRDYIVRVHPYRTDSHRIDGAVMSFFDITSRRIAENALRESEQRLALAFAALPVGICTVDTAGNMLMLNEVMRRFLPGGRIPSRHPEQVARWRGWDATGAPVQPEDFPGARALRGENVLSGMQMLYVDESGKECWTEVRAQALRDAQGNVSGAMVVVIDIDRVKRSEEAARQGEERHAFLLELGDALRAQPDQQSIMEQAVGMLAAHLRLDRCWISEVFEEQGISTVGPERIRPGLPPMAGIFQLADYPETMLQLATQPMVIPDVADDARFSESEKQLLDKLQLRALLVAPLRLGQGRVIWALATAMAAPRQWTDDERVLLEEVAERTWAAVERMRAERRAESILERMSDAHSVLDRDYRIVGINAAAERLLGGQRAGLLGRLYWEAFPGSVDAPVGPALRRVVEEGIEQHLAHHYTGGGYDLYLEIDAYPTDEGGLAMFWRDMTQRMQAELALRDSEEQYRALFNKMDEAYAVVEVTADADGRWTDFLFLEVNPAFMRHTGMPYPVGRTATQLLGTPNPRWAELYGHAARTGEPIRLEESEATLGRVFDLNIFRLGGEDSRRVAVVFTDITARKQAEDALKTADRRKDEFLATLAHELRNPLAPISNALQFLRYAGGRRRADRLLSMVERQVRHMVRLVDDLMEVTRISRGKVDLQRAPATLADVLHRAVEIGLPAFEQKRQQLTIDMPEETLTLDADKVRLTQVFANLLNNAAKYMAPGGQAWLTARRDAHDVLVTVRDAGMGIGREQLGLIFEMFSQPHSRNGRTDSGLGIGLAMVRSLVELHGGTVHAYSEGLGKGSEFVVRLPLIECPDAALREPDGSLEHGATPLSGRRVLVVDDNRDAADSLCQLLGARGADARAVYDGRSALDAVGESMPHAIVLDIGMPGMDGYEVARRLRQDGRTGNVKIVALSGWGQAVDRERSRASGFDHHFTKPADVESLLGTLSADETASARRKKT